MLFMGWREDQWAEAAGWYASSGKALPSADVAGAQIVFDMWYQTRRSEPGGLVIQLKLPTQEVWAKTMLVNSHRAYLRSQSANGMILSD